MINLLRIKIEKEKKNCIEYYKKNINTDEFKEYIKSSELVGDKNHREYIKKEHPEWLNRTDYYNNSVISGIDIYDVLSNNGVGRLLKKLYSLSKKEYSVKNYYKKPTSIQKYDYIRLQYSSSGYGRFAEIIFLNDKYIDGINISWVQINNYFALLEYKFKFKRCLDDTSYNSFILDNIDLINLKDYFNWYDIDNNRHVSEYYLALEQMHKEFFSLICQHYITSLLFSEQGQSNQLINLTGMTRKEPIDIVNFYNKWINTTEGRRFKFDWGKYRFKKKVVPENISKIVTSAVLKISAESDDEWHENIFNFIQKLKDNNHIEDYNQIAFLFRSVKNEKAINLSKYLEKNSINVYSPRSDMFFERSEIKLLLGTLMLMFPKYVIDLENNEFKYLQGRHVRYYKECIKSINKYLVESNNEEFKKDGYLIKEEYIMD